MQFWLNKGSMKLNIYSIFVFGLLPCLNSMSKFKFILVIFLLTLSVKCFSDKSPTFYKMSTMGESRIVRTRLMIAPVLSFYKINRNHADSPHQKMSGLFSLKEEVRLNYKHNMYFLFGVEYMVHGLNFNTYYFKQDSIQLYTGNFNYSYSLYMHEIDIPLQFESRK